MFSRVSDGFFGDKKKNAKTRLSLEQLKAHYQVMQKTLQSKKDGSESLIVETLRSIAENVIWGDQNDPHVFEYFLERDMVTFFEQVLRENLGTFVDVQLLQTLNILLDNLSKDTSIWFLLSNNHMNSIIVHEFDFTDEEVLAYYISFLKTLSMRLTEHTIHFFRNEHLKDFPLYFEAIKFFNHSENMVRIAVRTLTLNVFKVKDDALVEFLCQHAAPTYFANLLWVIGNQSVELDECLRTEADHLRRGRLGTLAAEHIDNFHYMNDIFNQNVDPLSHLLCEQALQTLFIPLYIYSLNTPNEEVQSARPQPRPVVGLYLLSHIFLIFSYDHLIDTLSSLLLWGTLPDEMPNLKKASFSEPEELLTATKALPKGVGRSCSKCLVVSRAGATNCGLCGAPLRTPDDETVSEEKGLQQEHVEPTASEEAEALPVLPSTESEEFVDAVESTSNLEADAPPVADAEENPSTATPKNSLATLYTYLTCSEDDLTALPALVLFDAMLSNKGLSASTKDKFKVHEKESSAGSTLVDHCLGIIEQAVDVDSKIRLATLSMAAKLLSSLLGLDKLDSDTPIIQPEYVRKLEGMRAHAIRQLSALYKIEADQGEVPKQMFLDLFEDEHRRLKPLQVNRLMNDDSVLLQPTSTPLTGIAFEMRLPCGAKERLRKATQIFMLLRKLCLDVRGEKEMTLPLQHPPTTLQLRDSVNLNNSDLMACNVISKNRAGQLIQVRRFMMIDTWRLVLLEPDNQKLGWGIIRFIADLNQVVVATDMGNTRALNISVHAPSTPNNISYTPPPVFTGRFVFDDHIRCVAARQYVERGRTQLRNSKLQTMEDLLGISVKVDSTFVAPS